MKLIWQSFALAILWFTRIPLPLRMSEPRRAQQQSLAWLPLIGALTGAFLWGIVRLTAIWSPWISALLAIGALMLITGALHEDGWADSWDALGSQADKERTLAILKDPRLGTYGSIALWMSLAIQVVSLGVLHAQNRLAWLPLIHALSRIPLPWIAWKTPYARTHGEGKADFLRESVSPWAWGIWLISSLMTLFGLVFKNLSLWPLPILMLGSAYIASLYWKHRLQGITGDTLGFCQQIALLTGLIWICRSELCA